MNYRVHQETILKGLKDRAVHAVNPDKQIISLSREEKAFLLTCAGREQAKQPIAERLLKNKIMNNEDIIFKLAAKENAKEIHSLMESVYHRLEDKSLFLCDDLAFVENHIENEGFTVIACHKDAKIVGSFIFRYPMQSDDNLGRDIGLQDHRLEKVVHMESVVVLPEFRGRGLQLSMLQYGEKLLEHSKFEYLMATVSPDNIWSHHSFEKNGCKLMATKEKYHGLMRRIYFKQLKKS